MCLWTSLVIYRVFSDSYLVSLDFTAFYCWVFFFFQGPTLRISATRRRCTRRASNAKRFRLPISNTPSSGTKTVIHCSSFDSPSEHKSSRRRCLFVCFFFDEFHRFLSMALFRNEENSRDSRDSGSWSDCATFCDTVIKIPAMPGMLGVLGFNTVDDFITFSLVFSPQGGGRPRETDAGQLISIRRRNAIDETMSKIEWIGFIFCWQFSDQSQVISPQEKRVVAYHECGHALVGWLLPHTDALLKVN